MKQIAKSGRKILFVATKKQAKDIVANAAKEVNMPYVTERWLGGMMTNFQTIRKSIKKMNSIDAMLADGSLSSINKKEKLTLTRERNKLEKVLGGIANINRLPTAVFVIDITHEHIAIKEAKKLGMKTFAVVDTNSNPNDVDFPIPGNDDASKSVKLICDYLVGMIKEGFTEKGVEKEAADKVAAIAKAAADKAAADKAAESKAAAEAKSAERAAAKAAKAAAQEAPAKDAPAAE
jgi:small subunit ribosomal protein S2